MGFMPLRVLGILEFATPKFRSVFSAVGFVAYKSGGSANYGAP